MPDDSNANITDQAQGSDAATTPDGPKYVTEDGLRAALDSTFANVRRMVESAKPKGAKAEAGEPTTSTTIDVQSALRRERDISEAFEDIGGVSREARQILRRLVDAERPDNVAEFIAQHAKAFTRPSGTATPTTQPRPSAANERPVSDAGSPAAPVAHTDDVPLWALSEADLKALIKTKGLGWYANTLRTQLKGTRIKVR